MLGYFWMVRGRNPGIRGRLRVHSWRGVGGAWGRSLEVGEKRHNSCPLGLEGHPGEEAAVTC